MAEPGRPLGEGAAEEAPTAPHATPRKRSDARTGPERFWARWPVRLALGASLVISGVAHCAVAPLGVPHGFEMKDDEGEASAIPIDLMEQEEPPPPPPPPPAPPLPTAPEDEVKPAASALAVRDAGPPKDAGADGSSDASADAPGDGPPDAPTDAPTDGIAGLDGAVALAADAGAADAGAKDIVGVVQADAVLVTVIVNAEVIRANQVGARMGYLLRGIPQWDEFMNGTDIDPVRDTDWVQITGPGLINTTNDVILIHYSASDAVIDRAVDVVSKKYDRGGRLDAGVPGVRASLAHADRGERVLLRGPGHLLAVVPRSVSDKVARQLVSGKLLLKGHAGEAVYLRLANPHHPMPEIPESITELRLRVVPRPDQGADVFIDCDTKDATSSIQAAEDVKAIFKRHNDWLTSSMTHGLLDHVEVTPDNGVVHVHLTASREQIETLVALVGDLLGVRPSSPVKPGGSASPTGPR